MFKLRNLRDIGLVLAGALAGASLFGVTQQTCLNHIAIACDREEQLRS
jgi:hypothetical protein